MTKSIVFLTLAAVTLCRAETTIGLLEETSARFRDAETAPGHPAAKSVHVTWYSEDGRRLSYPDEHAETVALLMKFAAPVARSKETPNAQVKARFLMESTGKDPVIFTLYEDTDFVTMAKAYEPADGMWQPGRAEDGEAGNAVDAGLRQILMEALVQLRGTERKGANGDPVMESLHREYAKEFDRFLDSEEFFAEYRSAEKAAARDDRANDPGFKVFYLAGFVSGVVAQGTLERLQNSNAMAQVHPIIRSKHEAATWAGDRTGAKIGYEVGIRIRGEVTARLLENLQKDSRKK